MGGLLRPSDRGNQSKGALGRSIAGVSMVSRWIPQLQCLCYYSLATAGLIAFVLFLPILATTLTFVRQSFLHPDNQTLIIFLVDRICAHRTYFKRSYNFLLASILQCNVVFPESILPTHHPLRLFKLLY